MSDSIEIKIDGPKLTPDKFQKAVVEFFALLKGVAKNISDDSRSDDWSITVCSGSARVLARGDARVAPATEAIVRGIKSLSSGVQSIPQFFTKLEVESARELAAVVDEDGKFVRVMYIQNGGAPLLLSNAIVKTADLILAGEKQIAFGSIEGTIESFRHKEGQPFTCAIRDRVHGRLIDCSFTTPEAEEIAYNAFRPTRRVLLAGLINYAKEGHAVRINANAVRVFPEEKDLPTLEEIHKFFK